MLTTATTSTELFNVNYGHVPERLAEIALRSMTTRQAPRYFGRVKYPVWGITDQRRIGELVTLWVPGRDQHGRTTNVCTRYVVGRDGTLHGYNHQGRKFTTLTANDHITQLAPLCHRIPATRPVSAM